MGSVLDLLTICVHGAVFSFKMSLMKNHGTYFSIFRKYLSEELLEKCGIHKTVPAKLGIVHYL